MRITSTPRRTIALAAVATLLLAAVGGAACEDTDPEADPTPVQTFKITPASNGPTAAISPTSAPETTPTAASEGSPTAPSGDTTTLTVVGVNSIFEQEELEAPAGTITVIFDNQDAGIVHNIHFFAGDEADDDASVGETELEVGPIEQTLTMTLEPGEYYYRCDAHPTTMEGVLTVR